MPRTIFEKYGVKPTSKPAVFKSAVAQQTQENLSNIPLFAGMSLNQFNAMKTIIRTVFERPIAGLRAVALEGPKELEKAKATTTAGVLLEKRQALNKKFKEGVLNPEKYPTGAFAEALVNAGMEQTSAGALGALADIGWYFGMPQTITKIVSQGKVKLVDKTLRTISEAFDKGGHKGQIQIDKSIREIARDTDVTKVVKAYVQARKLRIPRTEGLLGQRGAALVPGKQDLINAIRRVQPKLTEAELTRMAVPALQQMAQNLGAKLPTKAPEVPEEKPINYPNPAFQEHLNYVESIQLPRTSAIHGLKAQIRSVRGQRLAGRITPQEANQRVRALNKQVISTARKEGIAFRLTKGGNVKLSLRETGTYVPIEFARYPNFKDVKAVAGGGTDITRTIQNIDGALSVQKKLQQAGQAGPAEKHILWRTRDMVKSKISWMKTQATHVQRISQGIRPGSREDELLTQLLKRISAEDLALTPAQIFAKPEISAFMANVPPGLRNKFIQIAQQGRALYNDMITMQNSVREQMNLDDINFTRNYSPEQIRDTNVWGKASNFQKAVKDIMKKKAPLPDYIKPNVPFNPRAQAREHNIPYKDQEKSFIKLLNDYIGTASKDIFNTPIIQNNKAFIEQLRTNGFANSANALDNWTAEAYAGLRPALDRFLNLPSGASKAMKVYNRARNLGIFAFNYGWSVVTQTQSLANTIGRYGFGNTLKGAYDWVSNPALREKVSRDYYSFIIKAQRGGRASQQDVANMIGMAPPKKGVLEKVEDVAYFMIYEVEKLLTGASIRAAEITGLQKGLQGQALQEFASDGGGKTQSMYNDEDKPGMLRSQAVKTAAPFQTYAFEIMNTLKEWAGQTGTPPDDMWDRIRTVFRFLAATAVLQGLAYKMSKRKFFFLDPVEMPFPFAEYWLSPMIGRMTGAPMFPGRTLTAPVQLGVDVAGGVRDVMRHGNWSRLRRNLLRYGPGLFNVPGGGQLQRTVDGLIAYSQGGIRDVRGRLRVPVTNAWDVGKMIFFGPRALGGRKASGKVPKGLKRGSGISGLRRKHGL